MRATVLALNCKLSCLLLALFLACAAQAQNAAFVLERDGRVISLEPYAANIVRMTMSIDKAAATGAPGYGFVAKPSEGGWTHERDDAGNDVFRSSRMVLRLSPRDLSPDKLPQPMPLDPLNRQLREVYFGGGGGQGPYNDTLSVTTSSGKTLLHMRNWAMAPERADIVQQDIGAKGYSVAATFDSPSDEHYYGLGQQQKGWMDLRNHEIRCWHDYGAIAAKMSACRSWYRAAATGWCGTTRPKRRRHLDSMAAILGRQKSEIAFLSS